MKTSTILTLLTLFAAQRATASPVHRRQGDPLTDPVPNDVGSTAPVPSDTSSTTDLTTTSPLPSDSTSSISPSLNTTTSTSTSSNSSITTTSSSNSTATMTSTSTSPSSTPTDYKVVLQYALTLEHLESALYTEALGQFDEPAFEKAGMEEWVRGRFKQIADHESTHVQFLMTTLGSDAPAACNYTFPYDDPKTFAMLAYMLESVGNSAYLGAAQGLIDKPDVLAAAAAILSTEARHAGWIEAAVFNGYPWSGAFDTPLDMNMGFSLASAFITSCPSSNPQLPLQAFPNLTITQGEPSPGHEVTLSYTANSTMDDTDGSDNGTEDATQYLAFFSGLGTTFADISSNKLVIIPDELEGLVYAVVSSDNSSVSDDNVVAGPVVFSFPINSTQNVPQSE